MSIIILTDIPEWVRPLVDLLESRGIKVQVADDPEEIVANGLIVNRVSALLAERDKTRADRITHSLRTWEAEGRSVINGSLCFQIGYSKLAQAKLFTECGVRTPQTYPRRSRRTRHPCASCPSQTTCRWFWERNSGA